MSTHHLNTTGLFDGALPHLLHDSRFTGSTTGARLAYAIFKPKFVGGSTGFRSDLCFQGRAVFRDF